MKNDGKILALALCVSMSIYAPLCFGQGLLDQQLGDQPAVAPADAAAQKPAGAPDKAPNSDAVKSPAAGATEITSPDAVKKVDDADLIKKLTQTDDPQQAGNQAAQQAKEMLERMAQSQQRLIDKDPSQVTQETQRRIVMDLDTLIEYARQQQQNGPSKNDPNQQQQPGQQRTQGDNQQGGSQNQGGSNPAQASMLPGGGAETPDLHEDMRSRGQASWGGLPPRDRDLVSHGANEEYLPAYRNLIDRYYQALAEMGKTRH